MSLFPKTVAGWTRSLAFPLFAACLVLLPLCLFAVTDRFWRSVQVPLGWLVLGSGFALGVVCCWGRGLDRRFKWCALALAGLSAWPLFMPVLVE